MMIGIRKRVLKGKSRRKFFVLDRFLPAAKLGEEGLRGATAYNCDCRGGNLKRGIGLVEQEDENGRSIIVAATSTVKSVYPTWLSVSGGEDEKAIFLVCEDGYLYQVNLSNGRTTRRAFCGSNPVYVAIKDERKIVGHAFCGSEATVYTTDGATFSTLADWGAKGACAARGRLFLGASSRTVKYSAPYRLDEFNGTSDEGGEVYLPLGEGEILSLQTLEEKVYVFTERGIYCLSPAAESEDFFLERLTYEGGEICKGSVVATAQSVIFLATDGAYRVSDKRVEKICPQLEVLPNDANFLCTNGVCGELALIEYQTVDEDGGLVEKRVAIASDGTDGFFCERYGDLGGGAFCVYGSLLCRFACDEAETRYPISPYFLTEALDFGTTKRKFLKVLRAEGYGSVEVNVRCQGQTKIYPLRFERGEASVRLTEKGKAFAFYILPEACSKLRRLTVEYEEEA